MINVGLVGAGYWGPNIANSIEMTGLGKISWLCDLNQDRLEAVKKKAPSAQLTSNIEDLLNDHNLDAICISTPVNTHFKLAKMALEANKHVMVEKPITSTSEEALTLWKMAKEKNLKLMVGHVFEYNPAIKRIEQIIKNGELGQVQYISIERTNLGPIRTDVNALWDLATHDISILLKILNVDPINTFVTGQSFLNENVEDVVFANFSFPNKIVAQIHASWLNPQKVRKMTIVGNKKMLEWDDLDLKAPIKIFEKSVECPTIDEDVPDTFLAHKTACVDGGIYIPSISQSPPLLLECKHFLESIKNDKTPDTDGYNAFKVVRLLELATQSLSSGVPVKIQLPSREEC